MRVVRPESFRSSRVNVTNISLKLGRCSAGASQHHSAKSMKAWGVSGGNSGRWPQVMA